MSTLSQSPSHEREIKATARGYAALRAVSLVLGLLAGFGAGRLVSSWALAIAVAAGVYLAGLELARALTRPHRQLPLLRWLVAALAFLAALAACLWLLAAAQADPKSLALPVALAGAGFVAWGAYRAARRSLYRRAPWLEFEDQMHAAIVAPGKLAPSEVPIRLQWLRLRRASALLPAYRQALERAGKAPAAAPAIYQALLRELAGVEGLTADLGQVLGRAYLGLGDRAAQAGDGVRAVDLYLQARKWVPLPPTALQWLAGHYVNLGDRSPEAVDAYLAYLAAHRGQPSDPTSVACCTALEELLKIDERADRAQAGRVAELARRVIEADPDLDWAHFCLGLSLWLQDDMPPAVDPLERAAQLNPARAAASYYLGRVRLQQGQTQEALEALRRSLAADPVQPQALLWLGRTLVTLADAAPDQAMAQEAAELLQRAHDLEPERAEILYYLGCAHGLRGAHVDALAALEQAVALDGAQAAYHYRLALAQQALGSPQAAKAALERALALDSQLAPAHRLLGDLCLEAGRYPQAEAAYARALALQPADDHARQGLGRSLYAQGRFQEAVAQLTQVSALGPGGLFALARAQAHTGDLVRATWNYERWLERFGPSAEVSYYLGCARAHQGDLSGALAALDQAAALAPERADVLLQRGNVRLQRGDLAAAGQDLARARALAPESAEVAYALGVCYGRSGQDRQAAAELERAVQRSPGHAAAHFGLGLAHERRRDYAQAADAYRAALAHGAEPGPTHLRLGVTAARLGDVATAHQHLQEARQRGVQGDELLYYLGLTLNSLGRHEEAVAEWETLCQAHPDDRRLALDIARAYDLLGRQRFDEGDYERAIAAWERCQDIRGEDPPLRRTLAEAWFRLGVESLAQARWEEGRAALRQALSLGHDQERVHYYLGLGALAAGDGATAAEELAPLAAGQPENGRCRYHLGLALLQAGQAEEAVPVLQAALAAGSSERSTLGAQLALASAHVQAGRWAQAAELYRAALTGERAPSAASRGRGRRKGAR